MHDNQKASLVRSQDVLDAADISAITQLVLTERDSRDQGRWERMRECFHPDSLVRLSWFTGTGSDFVAGSINMVHRKVLAKHRLGPILVRLAGLRAVATLAAIIDIPTVISGIDAQLSSHARLIYRAEKREHRWRIYAFDAVYMRDELTPTLPGQSLCVTPAQVAAFRASYRMLSFILTTQGYTVNAQLPGEDRPATVDSLNEEVYGWAELDP